MKMLPFKASSTASIGVELELQIIDPMTYDLIAGAKNLIRHIGESQYKDLIKPEVTQSMIEINSSVHSSPRALYQELLEMRDFLLQESEKLGIKISGGGTHPFQKWMLRKIFPTKRFKKLSWRFRYLSKRSTVFGQHIHIGCQSADDAIYLTHALARYVPQFLALTASSPFYQGIDTGFQTSRSTDFNSFPLSGVTPYLLTWKEFSAYFYKLRKTGIVKTLKDFYWDIRPKPEFGTVELRVCDTPLTIEKSVWIAAYVQTLSHYLLTQKKFKISKDLYYFYGPNRFQAIRYGFDGDLVNVETLQHVKISDDILETIQLITSDAKKLKTENYMKKIIKYVKKNKSDANYLRNIYKKTDSLPKVVQAQCDLWSGRKGMDKLYVSF